MTTTTQPTTLRSQAIAELLSIRDTAAADLAMMPAAMAGSEWARDRYADVEWANRQLANLGVGPEEANRLASGLATDNSSREEITMTIWYVERCGSSNTANSNGWIGQVEARGEKMAEAAAQERFGYRTYNGQYLRVKLASRCPRSAHEAVAEAEQHEAEAEALADHNASQY
jgi:hypothetical protein